MQAIVFADRAIQLVQKPQPTIAPGEALLKIRRAGICATDLEVAKGYMGFAGVMGHEFVAEVVQGPDDWLGQRAVGEINCPCGSCSFCQAGRGNHCPTRTVLGIAGRDGVFAEYATLPVANLHAVPDSVSDRQAVFVEPLAAALQILTQVNIQPHQEVFVLGDGRLGQLVARVLATRTDAVTLAGRHESKLSMAAACGIQTVLADQFDPPLASRVVVDATGSPDGFVQAMGLAGPRGTIVLKSTTALGSEVNLAQLVIDEITVVGSRCGPFAEAIKVLAAKQVQVDDLITAEVSLSDWEKAFSAARDGQSMKVLFHVAG